MNVTYGQHFGSPAELLHEYFSLPGWAEAVAAAGAQVTVLQRFHQPATFSRQGVTYHFLPDRWQGNLRTWQIPTAVFQHARQLSQHSLEKKQPVIIHWHGLVFPWQTGWLTRTLPPACATVVQHHGELPGHGWRGHLQKWGFRYNDGFLFTNHELAQTWLDRRLIPHADQVYPIMETSSLLTLADKASARACTGLKGRPVILWTGNLKANKDPLTVLHGINQLLDDYPQARLYMAYREDELLAEVQQLLASHKPLGQATTLLGSIPYDQINDYYNSADIFVQGSSKEAAGIALLDALACGVIPVVTDIPAFRTITNKGTVGALWPIGDVTAFYEACLAVLAQPLAPQANEARHLFEQQWSFPAIGREAWQVYQAVWARKTAVLSC